MSTPRDPGVRALTFCGHDLSSYDRAWSAPKRLAMASLCSVEAVAMTVAPKALATVLQVS